MQNSSAMENEKLTTLLSCSRGQSRRKRGTPKSNANKKREQPASSKNRTKWTRKRTRLKATSSKTTISSLTMN